MIKSENTTLNLILALLPGFLALFIIGQIADIGDLKEFDLIFYGLILTFVCWALAWPFVWLWAKIIRKSVVWDQTDPGFLTRMGVFSIFVGIVFGIAIQNDVFFVLLRSIPGTDVIMKRTAKRPLPFLLSQNSAGKLRKDGDGRPPTQKVTDAWVRVKLKEPGKTLIFEGWPEFWGLGSEQSELYLSPACEVEDVVKKHKGPGVLIYEKEILYIEFIDRNESTCYKLWNP